MARTKPTENPFDKTDFKSMTVKQLRSYVRQATAEINSRDYSEEASLVTSFIQQIGLHSGQKTKSFVDGKAKLKGNVAKKSKKELQRQARELENFLQWDYTSKQGKKTLNKRANTARKTYNKRHKGAALTKREWENLAEQLGAIGSLKEKYGSDEIVKNYNNLSSSEKKKVNFVTMIDNIKKTAKEEGLVLEKKENTDVIKYLLANNDYTGNVDTIKQALEEVRTRRRDRLQWTT